MNFKIVVACVYIMIIYWLSLHVSFLDTLFFPTLGAFSLFFISRSFPFSEISRITLGAFISSVIGTLLFFIYPSSIMIFINVLLTIWLINKFKWNAPPIVGVSLIPFFSHSSHHLYIPLSVAAGMLGLMLFLYVAGRIEQKWADVFSFIGGNKAAAKSEKLDIAG
ncbi:HPP family protein [Brevibacillus brevis]|uniref:HPP family protein n=1 Tax=Brevibacillus brevis TaxID=1393 RepID=A0ABY9T8Y7_BREBE|nr:HPP family protein [Brevibacillus brevis]WNC15666.1 HPP family protein [Brevibacillus brevis]